MLVQMQVAGKGAEDSQSSEGGAWMEGGQKCSRQSKVLRVVKMKRAVEVTEGGQRLGDVSDKRVEGGNRRRSEGFSIVFP